MDTVARSTTGLASSIGCFGATMAHEVESLNSTEDTLKRILSEVLHLRDAQSEMKEHVHAVTQEQIMLSKAVGNIRDDVTGISRTLKILTSGVGGESTAMAHRASRGPDRGDSASVASYHDLVSPGLQSAPDSEHFPEVDIIDNDGGMPHTNNLSGRSTASESEGIGSMEVGEMASVELHLHDCWEPRVVAVPSRYHASSVNVFAKSSHADTDRARARQLVQRRDSRQAAMPKNKIMKTMSWIDRLTLPPSSDFLLYWTVVEGSLLTYDVIMIPVSVFEPVERAFQIAMRYIALVFWTLDMPVCFLKGYIGKQGEVERRFFKVAKHYLTWRDFGMDLLLLFIEYLVFFLWTSVEDRESGSVNVEFFRMLRFTRLLKVQKIRRVIRRMTAQVKSPENLAIIQNSGHLVLLFVMCHFGACGFYVVGDDKREGFWVEDAQLLPEQSDLQERYFTALQWSVAQMGFGQVDVQPVIFQERCYAVFFAMGCFIASALWLANLVASLMRLQVINKEDRENKEALRLYLQERGVSWSLRTRAEKVAQEAAEKKSSARVHEAEVSLLNVMPKTLAFELRAESFVPVLTYHPFFGVYGISNADRHAISAFLKTKDSLLELTVDQDQEVFTEREVGRFMYFLVSGAVVYRYRRNAKDVAPEGWLSEASLWLRWNHVGQAFAKDDSELVLIDAEIFRRIVQGDLPEASKYAKAFHKYVNDKVKDMNDLFPDSTVTRELALGVFEAPKVFELAPCQPQEGTQVDEWNPQERQEWTRIWNSPWTESCLMSSSALIATLTTEMKSDIILIFQTLFPAGLDKARFLFQTETDREYLDLRLTFLKRFFILLAIAGVEYTDTDNGPASRPWPFPLAATLCHGGRITIRLEDVNWCDLLNILLTGSKESGVWRPDNPPAPFYVRHAATHGMNMEMDSKHLQEVRRKGAAALSRGHYGVDLPVGGVGNPTPPHRTGELLVGPAGVPYKLQGHRKEAQFLDAYQHGHLYLRYDDFGKNAVRALIREDNQKAITHLNTFAAALDQESMLDDDDGMRMDSAPTDELGASRTQELHRWSHVSDTLMHGSIGKERKRLIHNFITQRRELKYICHSNGDLECRGFMIRLMLTTNEDGKEKALKHIAAHATVYDDQEAHLGRHVGRGADAGSEGRGSAMMGRAPTGLNGVTIGQEMHKEEAGCITVVCRRDESWLTALTRHLRSVFKLADLAVKQILDGCREEAYLFTGNAVPSFCYRHMEACGSDIKLHYDVILLQSVISMRDARVFKSIMSPRFHTVEENLDLQGFNGQLSQVQGRMTRQWMWADRLQVAPVPDEAQKLKVLVRHVHISSLLIGMESSAPLKEDLFGNEHNMAAQSKTTSAFGKRKWRDYRHLSQTVPAEMGGIRMSITGDVVNVLEQAMEKLDISKPSQMASTVQDRDKVSKERDFFKQLLFSTDAGADAVLRDKLGLARPVLHENM